MFGGGQKTSYRLIVGPHNIALRQLHVPSQIVLQFSYSICDWDSLQKTKTFTETNASAMDIDMDASDP